MKITRILALLAASVLFCRCGEPVPEPPQPVTPVEEEAYVKLDGAQGTSVSVGSEGAEFTLSFTTNKTWKAEVTYGSGSSGWVTLSSTNGTAGSQVLITTVQVNREEAKRTAVIAIRAGEASQNIVITQDPFTSEFSIENNSFDVEATGGTVEVVVTSNIGYHASTSVDWIRELGTKATQTASLFFVVDPNPSPEPRSGVIVICNDNEVCIPVTVNQAGGEASVFLSTASVEFGCEGGEQQVKVTSNGSWTVSGKPQWCNVSPGSAQGNATVIISAAENEAFSTREGKIVFEVKGSTAELTVRQQEAKPKLEVSDAQLSVPASGDEASFSIVSNVEWVVTSGAAWLAVSAESGTGNAVIGVSAEPNESVKARDAQVTVKTKDGMIRRTVTVSQWGCAPTISVSTGLLEFGCEAGGETVTVSSNADWTVSERPQWCTVSPSSAPGDASVRISVTENGNTFSREGRVVFKAGESTASLTVRQQEGRPELELSDAELSFNRNGGELSFTISSNADWDVNTGASWLKASPQSGTGNALITLTAERNTSPEVRTAQVSVTTKDGMIRRTITVSQAEGEVILELNVYELDFNPQGGSAEVAVTGNVSWTVSSSDPWCKVESNTPATSFTVTASANDSGKRRTARLTVKAAKGGIERTVEVSQSTPDDNEGFGDDGEITWD